LTRGGAGTGTDTDTGTGLNIGTGIGTGVLCATVGDYPTVVAGPFIFRFRMGRWGCRQQIRCGAPFQADSAIVKARRGTDGPTSRHVLSSPVVTVPGARSKICTQQQRTCGAACIVTRQVLVRISRYVWVEIRRSTPYCDAGKARYDSDPSRVRPPGLSMTADPVTAGLQWRTHHYATGGGCETAGVPHLVFCPGATWPNSCVFGCPQKAYSLMQPRSGRVYD
jgi:hypothetical protein